jgi:ankyrin repeat protein
MADSTALFESIEENDRARVDKLLRRHPSLVSSRNARGISPLMFSLYCGHPEISARLLAMGMSLDLHEAAASGRAERVEELVHADSSLVNTFSPDGFTPLGLSAFFGHQDIVEFLLTAGADPNLPARNPMHVMPLHSAAAHARPTVAFAIARQLLLHGARCDVPQEGGWTALHQAAAAGNSELVNLLLDCGADREARSVDGKSPLDMAIEKKHHQVAEVLRARSREM